MPYQWFRVATAIRVRGSSAIAKVRGGRVIAGLTCQSSNVATTNMVERALKKLSKLNGEFAHSLGTVLGLFLHS